MKRRRRGGFREGGKQARRAHTPRKTVSMAFSTPNWAPISSSWSINSFPRPFAWYFSTIWISRLGQKQKQKSSHKCQSVTKRDNRVGTKTEMRTSRPRRLISLWLVALWSHQSRGSPEALILEPRRSSHFPHAFPFSLKAHPTPQCSPHICHTTPLTQSTVKERESRGTVCASLSPPVERPTQTSHQAACGQHNSDIQQNSYRHTRANIIWSNGKGERERERGEEERKKDPVALSNRCWSLLDTSTCCKKEGREVKWKRR